MRPCYIRRALGVSQLKKLKPTVRKPEFSYPIYFECLWNHPYQRIAYMLFGRKVLELLQMCEMWTRKRFILMSVTHCGLWRIWWSWAGNGNSSVQNMNSCHVLLALALSSCRQASQLHFKRHTRVLFCHLVLWPNLEYFKLPTQHTAGYIGQLLKGPTRISASVLLQRSHA